MVCNSAVRCCLRFQICWIAVGAAATHLITFCSTAPLINTLSRIPDFSRYQSSLSGTSNASEGIPEKELLESSLRSRRLREAAESVVTTPAKCHSGIKTQHAGNSAGQENVEGGGLIDGTARRRNDLPDGAADVGDTLEESVDSAEDEWGGASSEEDEDSEDEEQHESYHLDLRSVSALYDADIQTATRDGEVEISVDSAALAAAPKFSNSFVSSVVAYELPVQMRPKERGADQGYLQLTIDEQRYYNLLNSPQTSESADIDNNQSNRQAEPKNNGVYMVCYVTSARELERKFMAAMQIAEGVYVPIQHMVDFGRHNDLRKGNPGVQEVRLLPEHYSASTQDWGSDFFDTVRSLKDETKLKVGGMWFGPPEYTTINRILKENPGIFDGIYIDWEDGKGACMNNFSRPPKTDANGNRTYWAENADFFFRYYMGGQDADACKLSDGRPYTVDVPVNAGRELTLPDGVIPVFPCFGGNEGLCYKAFSTWIDVACDATLQRYSFAIYDRYSDRMRLMLEEGCKSIGTKIPPMDFAGAL